MNVGSIAFALLAAHALGDFPLQLDWHAANKFDSAFVRFHHAGVHALLAMIAVVPFITTAGEVVLPGVGIFVAHFVIDTRRWAEPKDGFAGYPIAVDQSLHLASIYGVALLAAYGVPLA